MGAGKDHLLKVKPRKASEEEGHYKSIRATTWIPQIKSTVLLSGNNGHAFTKHWHYSKHAIEPVSRFPDDAYSLEIAFWWLNGHQPSPILGGSIIIIIIIIINNLCKWAANTPSAKPWPLLSPVVGLFSALSSFCVQHVRRFNLLLMPRKKSRDKQTVNMTMREK